MTGLRLRTQHRGINFHIHPTGEALLNGQEIGRIFPAEYLVLEAKIEDSDRRKMYAMPLPGEDKEAA